MKINFLVRQQMERNTTKPEPGGARPRAGRQTELLNQRQMTATEMVAQQFPDWSPLLHFATIVNDETLDPAIRLEAAKAAAPFIHPRPKPVDRDPVALVDLERKLAEARNTAKGQPDNYLDGLAERLERALQRAQIKRDGELQMASDQGLSNPIDGQSNPDTSHHQTASLTAL